MSPELAVSCLSFPSFLTIIGHFLCLFDLVFVVPYGAAHSSTTTAYLTVEYLTWESEVIHLAHVPSPTEVLNDGCFYAGDLGPFNDSDVRAIVLPFNVPRAADGCVSVSLHHFKISSGFQLHTKEWKQQLSGRPWL